MSIITGTLNTLEDTKRLEIQAQLQILLGQIELNKQDAQAESWIQRLWRPVFAWGISINILLYLYISLSFNILHSAGIHTGLLAPLDPIEWYIMGGLLGLYISARSMEKIFGDSLFDVFANKNNPSPKDDGDNN
jgi:hypothetical protein